MKKVFFISVFSILFLKAESQVLPSFGNSRSGTAGMQFLKISPDARAASMAGSFIAIANDVSALYWNPAAITRMEKYKWNVAANHSRYFAGISQNHLGATLKANDQNYWGLQVMSIGTGQMDETTEFQPTGTGRTFSSDHLLIGVSYARILTQNFSFGLSTKYAREGIPGYGVNNVLFDLGLHYDVGVWNTRFAVTLNNFGINVQPQGEVTILKYTGQQTINEFQTVSVPGLFRVAAAFDPIRKENHNLTVSAQLNHPTDNNETIAIGLEYTMRKIFFLRAGYEFGQDENGFPPMGAGFLIKRKFGDIRLDYAFINKVRLGNIHRIGFLVHFREK